MRKNLKGFTLVELLVAMAIIAVLIGLATFGINLALRGSRDSERRATLDSVRVTLSDYLATNNKYPDTVSYNQTDGGIKVGNEVIPVDSESYLVPIDTKDTSTNGTYYCYGKTTSGYALAVLLENGDYYDLGTDDSQNCTVAGADAI